MGFIQFTGSPIGHPQSRLADFQCLCARALECQFHVRAPRAVLIHLMSRFPSSQRHLPFDLLDWLVLTTIANNEFVLFLRPSTQARDPTPSVEHIEKATNVPRRAASRHAARGGALVVMGVSASCAPD